MVVGVFIPAMRTFELSIRDNGLLRQEIVFRALIANHRMSEFRIAVIALQNPFRHGREQTTLRLFQAFDIQEII
jgi:hypothetical protein